MEYIYLSTGPMKLNIKTSNKTDDGEHYSSIEKNKTYIWPKIFDNNHIFPRSLYKLKLKYSIEKIVIIDRVKNITNKKNIKDHINKSGINFLKGKTPFETFPTFPDVTHIYKYTEKSDIIVHTIGPDRFNISPKSKEIISESIGIVSPVWHYIGVLVRGIGTPV